MTTTHPTTILFTGYASVHFVCFRPLYERLIQLPGFEVFVSGGLRTKTDSGYHYDARAMYAPFDVPADRILSVEEIRERDFDVLFAANTELITPRRAGKRVQVFHGISFRNRAVREANMGCDHYFMVGPYMHRRFIQAGFFAVDDPREVKIGFAKTDRLVNGELRREEVMQRYEFDGSRPVILYAPTGLKHNSLETMGEDVIRRLAETMQYDLMIKPHDHPKNRSIDWFSRLAASEGPHTRVARDADVIPLLHLADLLITDASSVSSEYSLLDRPIVFLDVPKLIRKAMEREGSMADVDTWGRRAGVVVKDPAEVAQAVHTSLDDPMRHSDIRRAMSRDLFYNPGSATDAAMTWIRRTLAPTATPTPMPFMSGR